ncbi:MAG: Fic family protein [Psychromonas sp.]|jgi:Fic family protein|uniref:Fic family protein n=1 Tax=Psychromonas sp. TaxID=1884585 RepID=UPI0039E374E5
MMSYIPPFTLNNKILSLVASISEQLGALSATLALSQSLLLRKVNRVRTIQGSLAIEGNQLSEEQITAILDGKRVIAPAREVQEASNALSVYEQLDRLQFADQKSLLSAHKKLMLGLIDSAGQYRSGGVGVIKNSKVIHMAPPANLVPRLMGDLFDWLANSDDHALIKSCVFHYEFEFIHPFADGNGRMGRLWQTLILKEYHDVFTYLPVESLISIHQTDYYQAIAASTKNSNSAPFIEFMLTMIEEALQQLHLNNQSLSQDGVPAPPQVTPQVTPQVLALLKVMASEKNQHKTGQFKREVLQQLLKLHDKKSFNQRYIKPALNAGLIEMTIPDKPTSRLQQYRLTALGKHTYSEQS